MDLEMMRSATEKQEDVERWSFGRGATWNGFVGFQRLALAVGSFTGKYIQYRYVLTVEELALEALDKSR